MSAAAALSYPVCQISAWLGMHVHQRAWRGSKAPFLAAPALQSQLSTFSWGPHHHTA